MRTTDFGVLYFVDDNPGYQRMLRASIESLRRFHPDWPVKVIAQRCYHVPLWKRIYRGVSVWKWSARHARSNMDYRVICAKNEAFCQTPFELTLFIDADTVIMRPLDTLRRQAEGHDVLANPFPWCQYQGLEPWQPTTFQHLNSGVIFYNRRFIDVFREYSERTKHTLGRYHANQFTFSLACEMEKERLRIGLDSSIQVETMNLAKILQTGGYPRVGDLIDLRWEGLSRFHVFHYNGPHKAEYLALIKQLWNLPSDEKGLDAG